MRRLFARHYKLTHVKPAQWEVYERVLLGVIASEAFQIDNQDRRHVVNLDFLQGLLVVYASIAIPGIGL